MKIVNSREFEILADKWIDEDVKGAYNDRLRKISLQLVKMIVRASPVDTGRFKGSWDVEIDRWPTGTMPEGGTGGNDSAAEANAMRNAQGGLSGLKNEIPDFIGIGNNLDYGPGLEYGVATGGSSRSGGQTLRAGSRKSGTGFVRASVAAVKSMLRAGRFK